MDAVLDGLPIGTVAPSAVLSLIALMYFTGKLVPERVLKQLTAEKDRLIAAQEVRIDEQKDYIEVLKENNALYREQGYETTRVVRALPVPDTPVISEGT